MRRILFLVTVALVMVGVLASPAWAALFNFPSITNAPGGDGSDIGALEVQAAHTQNPRVIDTVPNSGAKGVRPNTNVKAFFSEDMKASTINRQTFKLIKPNSPTTPRPIPPGVKVGATVSYDASRDMAKLNPKNSLKRGTTYSAVVTTAAKDEAGNRFDQFPKRAGAVTGLQPKVWYFTVHN